MMIIELNKRCNEDTLLTLMRMQLQAASLAVGTTAIGRYEQISGQGYGVSSSTFRPGVEFEIQPEFGSGHFDTFFLNLDSIPEEFTEMQKHLDRIQAKADEERRLEQVRTDALTKVRGVLNEEEMKALKLK